MNKKKSILYFSIGTAIILSLIFSITPIFISNMKNIKTPIDYSLNFELNHTYIYQLSEFDESLATIHLEYNTIEGIFGSDVEIGSMYAFRFQSYIYNETLKLPDNITVINGWKINLLFWSWTNNSNDFLNNSLASNVSLYQFKNPSEIFINASSQIIYQSQYIGFPCPIINYLIGMEEHNILSLYTLELPDSLVTEEAIFHYSTYFTYFKFKYDQTNGLTTEMGCYTQDPYNEIIWKIVRL